MHTFVFSEDSKVSLYNVEGDTKMWTPVCIESIDIFSIPGQSQSCLSLVMFTVYCSLATFDLLVAIVAGVQVSLQLPTVGFGVCVCVYTCGCIRLDCIPQSMNCSLSVTLRFLNVADVIQSLFCTTDNLFHCFV